MDLSMTCLSSMYIRLSPANMSSYYFKDFHNHSVPSCSEGLISLRISGKERSLATHVTRLECQSHAGRSLTQN